MADEEDRGDQVTEEEVEETKEVGEAEETKAEKEEPEEEPTSGMTVPLSRFKAQNLRLREMEKELEELRAAQQKAAPQTKPDEKEVPRDFDQELEAAEAKLEAALKDNDAAAIMAANREIRAVERAQHKAELDALRQTDQETQNQLADRAFEETLSLIESSFPELDPTSSTHNPLKTQLVQDLLRSYEGQGMSSDDALLRATAMAYPESDLAKDLLGAQERKQAQDAQQTETGKRGLKEKLDAASRTPPNLNQAGGENSDRAGVQGELDPTKLTDEELDKLPPEVLKRLRGDTIAA